jgi:hypothetical protein
MALERVLFENGVGDAFEFCGGGGGGCALLVLEGGRGGGGGGVLRCGAARLQNTSRGNRPCCRYLLVTLFGLRDALPVPPRRLSTGTRFVLVILMGRGGGGEEWCACMHAAGAYLVLDECLDVTFGISDRPAISRHSGSGGRGGGEGRWGAATTPCHTPVVLLVDLLLPRQVLLLNMACISS